MISKKYGKLNNAKILPKADAFIAYGDIPSDYLESKDYFLDEKDIEKFNLEPIFKSGISIKRADSKRYQIIKMSPSTFKKLFGSNILASGASIYCTKEIEFIKNSELLSGWGVDESEFISYFNQHLDINILSVTNSSNKRELKLIKKFSNFIFFGIGNFDEPFTAHWLYEYGEFRANYVIPFTVTTGSGRSKGVYTLVLKPKY